MGLSGSLTTRPNFFRAESGRRMPPYYVRCLETGVTCRLGDANLGAGVDLHESDEGVFLEWSSTTGGPERVDVDRLSEFVPVKAGQSLTVNSGDLVRAIQGHRPTTWVVLSEDALPNACRAR